MNLKDIFINNLKYKVILDKNNLYKVQNVINTNLGVST